MAISLKIIEYFQNIFPDWHMVVVDSCELSRGIATLGPQVGFTNII